MSQSEGIFNFPSFALKLVKTLIFQEFKEQKKIRMCKCFVFQKALIWWLGKILPSMNVVLREITSPAFSQIILLSNIISRYIHDYF